MLHCYRLKVLLLCLKVRDTSLPMCQWKGKPLTNSTHGNSTHVCYNNKQSSAASVHVIYLPHCSHLVYTSSVGTGFASCCISNLTTPHV